MNSRISIRRPAATAVVLVLQLQFIPFSYSAVLLDSLEVQGLGYCMERCRDVENLEAPQAWANHIVMEEWDGYSQCMDDCMEGMHADFPESWGHGSARRVKRSDSDHTPDQAKSSDDKPAENPGEATTAVPEGRSMDSEASAATTEKPRPKMMQRSLGGGGGGKPPPKKKKVKEDNSTGPAYAPNGGNANGGDYDSPSLVDNYFGRKAGRNRTVEEEPKKNKKGKEAKDKDESAIQGQDLGEDNGSNATPKPNKASGIPPQ